MADSNANGLPVLAAGCVAGEETGVGAHIIGGGPAVLPAWARPGMDGRVQPSVCTRMESFSAAQTFPGTNGPVANTKTGPEPGMGVGAAAPGMSLWLAPGRMGDRGWPPPASPA